MMKASPVAAELSLLLSHPNPNCVSWTPSKVLGLAFLLLLIIVGLFTHPLRLISQKSAGDNELLNVLDPS